MHGPKNKKSKLSSVAYSQTPSAYLPHGAFTNSCFRNSPIVSEIELTDRQTDGYIIN